MSMTEQSNNQTSTEDLCEISLSLRIEPFKFHVLLECSGHRLSTLGHDLLQFIPKTQQIVEASGREFQHPLKSVIWNMVVKCKRLGDGDTITILAPVNDATGNFDWETKNTTREKANLWVRVFEVGSACVIGEEAIKADIDRAGKEYAYWKRVQTAVLSEPVVLEFCSISWKEALGTVERELVEAREKFAEAHTAWMKPTKIG